MSRLLRATPPQPKYVKPTVVYQQAVPGTPGQLTLRTYGFAAQQRPGYTADRFPRQGWDGTTTLLPPNIGALINQKSTFVISLGDTTSGQKQAVGLPLLSSDLQLSSVVIPLGKVGAPADDVLISIWSGASQPTTLIASGAPITAASLSATPSNVVVPLSTPLSRNVQYWIVAERSGALSDTDRYSLLRCTSFNVSQTQRAWNGSTWNTPVAVMAFTANFVGEIIAYPARFVGPRPPLMILPRPTATTVLVNTASGVLTNQRRAQQRRTTYDLRPPTVVAPPTVIPPITVRLAARHRRDTEVRRFPLQGWDGGGAVDALSGFALRNNGVPNTGGIVQIGDLTNEMQATSFTGGGQLRYVNVALLRFGSPSDGVLAEIRTDSGGSPSTTILATSASFSGASLPLGLPALSVRFAFDGLSLNVGQTYWIVLRRTGALDNTDFYGVGRAVAGSTAGAQVFTGSIWDDFGTYIFSEVGYEAPAGSRSFYGYKRNLGPFPPLVINPLPSQQQQTVMVVPPPVSVMSRAQAKRRSPKSLLFPPATLAQPPPARPISVNYLQPDRLARRARRQTPILGAPQALNCRFFEPFDSLNDRWTYTISNATVTIAGTFDISWAAAPAPGMDTFASTARTFHWGKVRQIYWEVPVAPPNDANSQFSDFGAFSTESSVGAGEFFEWSVIPAYAEPGLGIAPPQWAMNITGLTGHVRDLIVADYPLAFRITHDPNSGDPTWGKWIYEYQDRPTRVWITAFSCNGSGPGTRNEPGQDQAGRIYIGHRGYLTGDVQFDNFSVYYECYSVEDHAAVSTVRTRPSKTHSFLSPPAVVAAATTFVASPLAVTLARTRPRRRALSSLPLLVVPSAATFDAARPKLARIRPRDVASSLPLVIVTSASPVETVVAVTLVRTRPRRTVARIAPPTTLQVFSGAKVTLVRTRPVATRRYLKAPTVVRVPSVEQRQQTIAVTLVRTRPRSTTRRLGTPTVLRTFNAALPAFARIRPRGVFSRLPLVIAASSSPVETTINVSVVRTRPRHTTARIAPPTVLQVFSGPAVTLTRIRPRPTRRYLTAPTVVRVPAVEQREQTISVTLVRARPRPTTRRLSAPTVLRTFPAVVPTLTRIRPRRTGWLLRPPTVVRVPSVEQQEDTIRVSLVRIRPRPTGKRLAAPAALQIFTGPTTHLVRTRPRATVHTLGVPTVLQTFGGPAVSITRIRPRPTVALLSAPAALQVFSGPLVAVTRIRPRPTSHFFTEAVVVTVPAVEQQEETVKVTVVRTRPRPTTKLLSPPTVLQTFEAGTPTLARIRPRPTDKLLAPPTVIRVPSVEQREQTVTVTLVRTRPRQTRWLLSEPTVLRVPSVEQRQQTVRVSLVRTRPRPTTKALFPPTVLSRPPVRPLTVSYLGPNQRRDWNRRFPNQGQRQRLVRETGTTVTCQQRDPFIGPRPPQIIDPLPDQRAQTVTVTLVAVRTRRELPRHVVKYALRPPTRVNPLPTQGQQTIEEVYLQAIRRRTTDVRRLPHSVLGEAVVARPPVETEIRVLSQALHASLDRIPRRIRSVTVEPVSYPQTSTITVVLTRTRPRPTISRLTAVSYPQTGEIQVTVVRTRPRPKRALLKPPTVVRVPSVEQAEDTIRVTAVRIRPRPKQAVLRRPATLTVFSGPQTHLTRIRPRPTHPVLRAPAAVLIPAVEQRLRTITVSLVRIRPPQTHVRLTPPTVLRTFGGPVEAEVSVSLVSARPRRLPHSRLAAPTVVAAFIYPPLIQRLTPGRRPAVHARLSPPTILRTEPPVDVRPTVALVSAKTRQRFRVGRWTLPKILPPYPSVLIPETTGAAVPTAYSDGHSVPAGDTDGAARASTATEGRTVPVAESDGKAVPDATTDGGVLT